MSFSTKRDDTIDRLLGKGAGLKGNDGISASFISDLEDVAKKHCLNIACSNLILLASINIESLS